MLCTGYVVTICGNPELAGIEGALTDLFNPLAIAVDRFGRIFISEGEAGGPFRIRIVSQSGIIIIYLICNISIYAHFMSIYFLLEISFDMNLPCDLCAYITG